MTETVVQRLRRREGLLRPAHFIRADRYGKSIPIDTRSNALRRGACAGSDPPARLYRVFQSKSLWE